MLDLLDHNIFATILYNIVSIKDFEIIDAIHLQLINKKIYNFVNNTIINNIVFTNLINSFIKQKNYNNKCLNLILIKYGKFLNNSNFYKNCYYYKYKIINELKFINININIINYCNNKDVNKDVNNQDVINVFNEITQVKNNVLNKMLDSNVYNFTTVIINYITFKLFKKTKIPLDLVLCTQPIRQLFFQKSIVKYIKYLKYLIDLDYINVLFYFYNYNTIYDNFLSNNYKLNTNYKQNTLLNNTDNDPLYQKQLCVQALITAAHNNDSYDENDIIIIKNYKYIIDWNSLPNYYSIKINEKFIIKNPLLWDFWSNIFWNAIVSNLYLSEIFIECIIINNPIILKKINFVNIVKFQVLSENFIEKYIAGSNHTIINNSLVWNAILRLDYISNDFKKKYKYMRSPLILTAANIRNTAIYKSDLNNMF